MDDDYDEFGNYVGSSQQNRLGQSQQRDNEDVDMFEQRPSAEGMHEDGDAEDAAGEDDDVAVEDTRMMHAAGADMQIVLHENKQYYPDASSIYPAGTDVVYHTADAEMGDVPLVAPTVQKRTIEQVSADAPQPSYSTSFMHELCATKSRIRNVLFAGAIHHGKTSLLDLLLAETHPEAFPPLCSKIVTGVQSRLIRVANEDDGMPPRIADGFTEIERDRCISLRSKPVSLLLQNSKGTSYAVNVMDTPGHNDFIDETGAALRLADGLVLVVDAVEGVTTATKRILQYAVSQPMFAPDSLSSEYAPRGMGGAGVGSSVDAGTVSAIVIISKLDRLITELKLPPRDAYFKLKYIVDEMNSLLPRDGSCRPFDPRTGNVLFSSAAWGFCFSLDHFASIYAHMQPSSSPAASFVACLWGDVHWDAATNKFLHMSQLKLDAEAKKYSFVEFVLHPLYKIATHCISTEGAELGRWLARTGIRLNASELSQNLHPLLRTVFARWFSASLRGLPSHASLVDAMVEHLPSPAQNAARKVRALYKGRLDSMRASAMMACAGRDSDPLVAHVVRTVDLPYLLRGDSAEMDCQLFALTRVFSGVLRVGDRVRLLGESYVASSEEEEFQNVVVGALYLPVCPLYTVPVTAASAGQWVLVGGMGNFVTKSATILSPPKQKDEEQPEEEEEEEEEEEKEGEEPIFHAVSYPGRSPVRLAIEPLEPKNTPRFVEAVQTIVKLFVGLQTHVEETGERQLIAPGELYLDVVMRLLRERYAKMEIRVSDPFVSFCETIVERSALRCFAESTNKRNKVTMVAEPLDPRLVSLMEAGALPAAETEFPRGRSNRLAPILKHDFGFTTLAARRVWAFSPFLSPCAMLRDDTLPLEVSPHDLAHIHTPVVQGFRWSAREGPLCNEPVRNVAFRILDATLAPEAVFRGATQINPMARRCIYAAFLLGEPRLLEPVYHVEILVPQERMQAVAQVLARRRGHIYADAPRPGTPLHTLHALLPVMESFGFETDVRAATRGLAFPQLAFDHWQLVPGDPLDTRSENLARECMVKTRRRKGLSDDLVLSKYMDEDMLRELANTGLGIARHIR